MPSSTSSFSTTKYINCHLPGAAVTSLFGSRDLPKASPRTNQCYVGFLLQLWPEPRVILQAHFYIMVKEKSYRDVQNWHVDLEISWSHNTDSLVASARIGVIFAASSATEKPELPPAALCAHKTAELLNSSVTSLLRKCGGGGDTSTVCLFATTVRAALLRSARLRKNTKKFELSSSSSNQMAKLSRCNILGS